MKEPATDLTRLARQVGIFTAIPMILVGGPTLGFVVGQFLDRRFGSDPWGVAVAVLAGLFASGIETVRLIRYVQRKPNSSEHRPS